MKREGGGRRERREVGVGDEKEFLFLFLFLFFNLKMSSLIKIINENCS